MLSLMAFAEIVTTFGKIPRRIADGMQLQNVLLYSPQSKPVNLSHCKFVKRRPTLYKLSSCRPNLSHKGPRCLQLNVYLQYMPRAAGTRQVRQAYS